MHCELCRSSNQVEFTAEMLIHFSGLKNIDHPGVPGFPKILVCLDCGSSRFVITQAELGRLRKRPGEKGPQPLQGSQNCENRTPCGLTS
jgi:hypothetical protein